MLPKASIHTPDPRQDPSIGSWALSCHWDEFHAGGGLRVLAVLLGKTVFVTWSLSLSLPPQRVPKRLSVTAVVHSSLKTTPWNCTGRPTLVGVSFQPNTPAPPRSLTLAVDERQLLLLLADSPSLAFHLHCLTSSSRPRSGHTVSIMGTITHWLSSSSHSPLEPFHCPEWLPRRGSLMWRGSAPAVRPTLFL